MDFSTKGLDQNPEDYSSKIILAISAHPDDLEFCCGGTLASWIEQGAQVYYLILTDGSKGSEDHAQDKAELIEIRKKEQRSAASVLGVRNVIFLDFVDGELINHPEVQKEIVKVIRKIKPNVVLGWDPSYIYDEDFGAINHPDHRASGQAMLDAVFPFARNSRTFPDLMADGLNPHSVEEVWLFNFRKNNFFVDITDFVDIKIKALSEHHSQQDDSDNVHLFLKAINEKVGKKIGKKYAEGFIRVKITT